MMTFTLRVDFDRDPAPAWSADAALDLAEHLREVAFQVTAGAIQGTMKDEAGKVIGHWAWNE